MLLLTNGPTTDSSSSLFRGPVDPELIRQVDFQLQAGVLTPAIIIAAATKVKL